jgi:ATP-dependent protease HslVU (ClpYQ) ATPase subunit
MRLEVMVEPLDSKELPAYEVTVKVTQCQNRFEIIAKPGAEIDSWQVQALLANWLRSRVDSEKTGGHNPSSSERG